METIEFDELEALSQALENPASGTLGEILERVARTATRKLDTQAPDVFPFMERMKMLLQRIPGDKHSGPRVDAMLSALMYSYFKGPSAKDLDFGAQAVALARRTGDPLLRKALSFHGVINADMGNVARAIECYAVPQACDNLQIVSAPITPLP